MVKIKIDPNFFGLGLDIAEINLPVKKVVGKFLRFNAEPILAGDLVAWCLQKVLADQYTAERYPKDIAVGAWSKRYPEYIKFIYDRDIPPNVSWYDSITISGQIAEALIQYSKKFPNTNLTKAILPRLNLLREYLKRHYNRELEGFGLATGGKYKGSPGISVDIRHTTWAVIALWYLAKLGIQDSETDEMLRDATGSINKTLKSHEYIDKYALTYAVFHKLLTINGLSSVVITSDKARRSALKRIEGVLVDRFAHEYNSWDPDDLKDDPRISIDNALSVLGPIRISSCIDSECSKILKTALNHLCERSLIPLDDKTMALPFYEGGEADIGATIELLWCIINNKGAFMPKKGVVEKMINFIVDPSNQDDNLEFAYPWNLSSALLLATESK